MCKNIQNLRAVAKNMIWGSVNFLSTDRVAKFTAAETNQTKVRNA